MQKLPVFEVHGIRVLTTRQLATMYETKPEIINNNFIRNKNKYVLEKHYVAVSGEEMRSLRTSHQFDGELKRVSRAYFWTEKGALLHAKSLNTDKAWEVYDYLVDFYFRAKEKQPEAEQKKEVVPVKCATEQVKSGYTIPDMKNPVFILKNLLALAERENMKIEAKDLEGYTSMLYRNRIALRRNLAFEKAVYEIAYELAHYFIHYDQGNMIDSPLAKDYNQQAERAASMMIRMLDIKKSIA